MFWTNTKRIIKSGITGFRRSGLVSVSSIFAMVIALSMIGSTMLITAFMDKALHDIEEKIDINVYFTTDAPEEMIAQVKKDIESLPETKLVTYVSREDALADFRARHANDQITLEALESLEENPLRPVLNIRAHTPGQYENIVKFLEQEATLSVGEGSVIDKINYNDNKTVIDRLSRIISGAEKLGFGVSLVLILISIFITFNTIRLVIFISREEISVMKLVGADTKYIRGPFIVAGIAYGVIAGLITMLLFYPATLWLRDSTASFYGGIDMYAYYVENFWQMLSIILLAGVSLGAVASFLAVRRHLK